MADNPSTQRSLKHWLQDVVPSLPVMLGYLPVGFAYGVLAHKAGLGSFNTILMSLIVYAGSAQLIAVGMFAGGAAPVAIVVTTLIVNLRHLLMAAALSPYLQHWRSVDLAVFAGELTDETFGLHSVHFARERANKSRAITVNLASQFAWVVGSVLGLYGGQLIGDIRHLALDYALPAMFIALLVMQLRSRIDVLVAALSGALAVGLALSGINQWYVILATIISATVGLGVDKWTRK